VEPIGYSTQVAPEDFSSQRHKLHPFLTPVVKADQPSSVPKNGWGMIGISDGLNGIVNDVAGLTGRGLNSR
jgi:hypothetical protein